MRLVAVHTCPLWEESDGKRRPGFGAERDHPPVVGWCNVLVVELHGERRLLMAAV